MSLRQPGERWLLAGALVTSAAAILHVAIIVGGPEWYRFFGAGERMARLSMRGSSYPAAVTTGIAMILALWALYGFSAAGVIPRLPFLRPALALIAGVYLARGLLGIPIVWLVSGPYMNELRGRWVFMSVTSLVCVGLGICYAIGCRYAPRCGKSR